MRLARAMGRETVLALLALALFFFNFAHAATAVAYDAKLTPYLVMASAAPDDCAEGGAEEGGHAPCHACRIGDGAALPPAAGGVLRARRLPVRVGRLRRRAARGPARAPKIHPPRGPPID